MQQASDPAEQNDRVVLQACDPAEQRDGVMQQPSEPHEKRGLGFLFCTVSNFSKGACDTCLVAISDVTSGHPGSS